MVLNQRGFLLVDLMVAVLVIGIAVGAAGGVFSLFQQAGESHGRAEGMAAAQLLGQRYQENWKKQSKKYWHDVSVADPSNKNPVNWIGIKLVDDSGVEQSSIKETYRLYNKDVLFTVDNPQLRVRPQTIDAKVQTAAQAGLVEVRFRVSWTDKGGAQKINLTMLREREPDEAK